jgi:hypothetical protein
MAVDPFNSVGGYTVGIPPMPIIDSNGNLTVNNATIGNVNISGDQVVTGNIIANTFIGSFQGEISGTIALPGGDTEIVFNTHGQAGSSSNLKFDYANSALTVNGNFHANAITLGVGSNEFSTASVMFAITNSTNPGQILHFQPASDICSVDYTIIATDPTANVRQTSKLFASVLGTEVGYFEYGTIDVPQTSPGVADFKVEYISGNIALTVKPMTAHTTSYKIMVTSYKE